MKKVYVSSTYTDLVEQRAAAARQMAKLRDYHVIAMENYVASDQRPLQQCLADVAACDIYVGIIAWRYGFIPEQAENPERLSITELEYRMAREKNKPCLMFVLSEKAAWLPGAMDLVADENGKGARIAAFRKELQDSHTATIWDTTERLVTDLVASLSNLKAPEAAPAAAAAPRQELREIQRSLLLAYAPIDTALATGHATALQGWLDRPILASEQALFAVNEAGFDRLESQATSCSAALVVISPSSLPQLTALGDRLPSVLSELRSRMSAVGALACGVSAADLPASWGFGQRVLELSAPVPGVTSPLPPEPLALKIWLDQVMPPRGSRSIGLPVSVLCMTAEELQQLKQHPEIIGQRLGGLAEAQFNKVTAALAAANVDWQSRYGATRASFRPFDANEPIGELMEGIADAINERQPLKLRQRRIKLQWYPFDAVKAYQVSNDARLRTVYRNVARTGCIFVVDEMSLFHPDLHEAFRNSPFSNNDQVSLVSLSPFDPSSREIERLLDQEPRGKISGALDRFVTYYDPQCELAVSDARRLRRWLHWSLPETVTSLREPRPNQAAMSAFFANELGSDRRQSPSDYPWAGGAS